MSADHMFAALCAPYDWMRDSDPLSYLLGFEIPLHTKPEKSLSERFTRRRLANRLYLVGVILGACCIRWPLTIWRELARYQWALACIWHNAPPV
jgi:hypothetical protein